MEQEVDSVSSKADVMDSEDRNESGHIKSSKPPVCNGDTNADPNENGIHSPDDNGGPDSGSQNGAMENGKSEPIENGEVKSEERPSQDNMDCDKEPSEQGPGSTRVLSSKNNVDNESGGDDSCDMETEEQRSHVSDDGGDDRKPASSVVSEDGGDEVEQASSNVVSEDCEGDELHDAKSVDRSENGASGDESVVEITEAESVKTKNNVSSEALDEAKKKGKNVNKTTAPPEGETKKPAKDKKESGDDIMIIGESKLVKLDSPSLPGSASQNVILTTSLRNGLPFTPTAIPVSFSSSLALSLSQGLMTNGAKINTPPPISLLQTNQAPPKPKSSLDQIELIRWEIQNRLNTRPKYFKPSPSAELGPLAKFLFDIGSNLIKEAVYHELVKIQSKKNDDNALSEKEKEDLGKLKEIEKDLHSSIGHLKLKMKKRCRVCNFHTESTNVLYLHKQFPHEDEKKLHCAHCAFVTKQPMAFKFHIESEHGIQPRLYDRKAYFECDLCPYENNQEQKLTAHKLRCAKQFRALFNLHPSCLSGAEINLCLENIFYKPIVPKNLKILQQKHAQQQAALAEARRQQAEMQALAAQKQAAALAAKKRSMAAVPVTPRFNPPNIQSFQARPSPKGPPIPAVRYNSRPAVPVRPTVANMLKEKTVKPVQSFTSGQNKINSNVPGGFEVCEICGGYVKDRKALRIHFFYAHRIDLPFNLFDRSQPPLYCATCYVRFWTAQGLRKHIDIHVQEKKVPDSVMGEGVHGKCISCSQLVGNVVVHMRVVHNREIHHYINALMCMFCGASFNSRPNVERHITDIHGTVDIATGAIKAKPRMKATPPQQSKPLPNPKRPSGGKDSLVKGSVCVLCNLNFGRNVDLTRHCMRMHHTCMKCGMVVIDKASLLKHTCLASPHGTRDCTMCSETGFHPAYYVKHLRDKHLKKFSITIGRVSAPVIEKWIKRPYPFNSLEPVEISDSEDEDSAPSLSKPSENKVVAEPSDQDADGSPKKKAKIGPASKIGRAASTQDNGIQKPGPASKTRGKRKMSVESTPERVSKRRK